MTARAKSNFTADYGFIIPGVGVPSQIGEESKTALSLLANVILYRKYVGTLVLRMLMSEV